MEEILVLLFQFVVEILFQFLIYLPFDFPLSRDEKTGARKGVGWLLLYVLVGGALGGVSLFIAPHLIIPSPILRMVNLMVAPLMAGAMSWLVAWWRQSRGATADPWTHLWTAFWFVLAFAAVRLAYASQF